MTVAATITAKQYTSTGATQYAFPNKIFSASDLVVTLIDLVGNLYLFANFANAATGLSYTVQGVDVDTGCTVVFSAAQTSGWTVDIRTVTPEVQSTSIKNQGSFLPELHEEAFDRLTREIQDLLRLTYTYGIHGPDIETTPWPALPNAAARKGLSLVFDPIAGLPTVGASTTTTVTAALIASLLSVYSASPVLPSYATTPAEVAAATALSVSSIISNFSYLPGDLRRYGADVTGAAASDTAILYGITAATQSGGTGFIWHPGGTIAHAFQVPIPNNIAILGWSRAKCTFLFTGSPSGSPAATRSAWRYTGVTPWSGYANVFIRDVQFIYQNAVNFAACLEISAWGWAYFDIDRVWVKGSCSYGIILDGAEICSVNKCLIENINAVANGNIWIVNGADRGFNPSGGSPLGFSNVITIRENQISSNSTVAIGLIDDGGNAHIVQGNNFNGHRIPATFAGTTGLRTGGNSYETQQTTGPGNVIFSAVSQAGNPVGPCSGCQVSADGFFGGISGGALLVFAGTLNPVTGITKATQAVVTISTGGTVNPLAVGAPLYFSGVTGMTQINGQAGYITAIGGSSGAWTATVTINTSAFTTYSSGGQSQMMHTGFMVSGNNFGSTAGRGSAIDVTFLANSQCFANTDLGILSGMSHYAGAHNDNNGNVLMPPQNGFSGGLGIGTAGALFGDSRYPYIFANAVGSNGATPPAQLAGWGTPTGPAVQLNYSGSAGTLPQTSAAVAQIIAYLKSKGDFAA